MNINCHCCHTLFGPHKCEGEISEFELDPGQILMLCENCQLHIKTFDLQLAKQYGY